MMKAAIDIGSNTVLLLVAELSDGRLQVIREEQYAPRLGRGVDVEKNLHPDSMRRVIKLLGKYHSILEDEYHSVNEVSIVATSAVRDANNRQQFSDDIKQATGYTVKILSGEQEAEYTFTGAQSVLAPKNGNRTVIDIGGGSTEIAVGEGRQMTDRHSFNIGSVRFTERYLKESPPTAEQIKSCSHAIDKALAGRSFTLPDNTEIIGVAGTVTSLAAIKSGHQAYQPKELNGLVLKRDEISSMVGEFSKLTAGELLERHPAILAGRADVILGGMLILEGFMNAYDIENLAVSTGGIRHGAILEHK
jgi:exopolyphosphatase/guanosine-5'-triphosphate,3'-diphosphate pyrophosphatase